jgi:hypothetical protein
MQGRVPLGVPMFLVLCAIVLPLTVLFARLFAEVFELPFQRRRGWGAVRDALHLPARRAGPAGDALDTRVRDASGLSSGWAPRRALMAR